MVRDAGQDERGGRPRDRVPPGPVRRGMGRLVGRSRAPAPTPLPSGNCQFLDAWTFSIGPTFQVRGDPNHHEGALRTLWFVPLATGGPMAFTICGEHATEFVRYTMVTGRNPIAR